jgi:hypothetical protein
MKNSILILTILFPTLLFSQSLKQYSDDEIISYFKLAQKLSELDNGKLWGIKLYGPIMLVNSDTRKIYTNVADKNNKLKAISNNLFTGQLDKDELFANTATKWNGVHWTQVILNSFNESDLDNGRLLIHECWHRVQDSIGFPGANSNNNHLDELEGRIYLQLEWKALQKALKNKKDRLFHIESALIFRNYRRSLFEGSAINENKFEMHEGLAEYTGFSLSTMPLDTIINRLEHRINRVIPTRKYSHSFAYIHGIAYGMLLESYDKEWNKSINPNSDFGEEIKKASGIKLPKVTENLVQNRLKYYDGKVLIETEKKHEIKIQKQKEIYRKKFITGDILSIPCKTIGINFNPNNIINFDDYGRVYETITVKSNWGVLKATKGLLVWKTWNKVIVSKPVSVSKSKISGDGWEIELKEAWKVVEMPERNGSFVLVKNITN